MHDVHVRSCRSCPGRGRERSNNNQPCTVVPRKGRRLPPLHVVIEGQMVPLEPPKTGKTG